MYGLNAGAHRDILFKREACHGVKMKVKGPGQDCFAIQVMFIPLPVWLHNVVKGEISIVADTVCDI